MPLYHLGQAPDCSHVQSNVGHSLPWPETKCYLIETLGVSLALLDFDQGASRGLGLIPCWVRLGYSQALGNKCPSLRIPKALCRTHGNAVVSPSMTTDDREAGKLAQVDV